VTADAAVLPLAAGFANPGHAAWLALAERTLKGAPIESLTWRTVEGLEVGPLYQPAAWPPLPGGQSRGWDIRAVVGGPDVAAANAQATQDLAGGATSLLIQIDPAGAEGLAVADADGLARVLEGVLVDIAPIALDAGFLGAKAADWLATAAKGAPAAALGLGMDPLSAFARAGASPGPIEAHLIACAGVGARLAEPYPKASLFLASGRAAHDAGGGEALELATALASALAYAKALVRAGLASDAAFERIVLGIALDADLFLTIAKLRAARLLWSKLAGACGCDAPARIEGRSSARMLTRADPWTNMIRLTAAAFAGAVGGADTVVLGTFTDALGLPSALARRQARNIQLVLAEEANLGRVCDPAAGCGYVEDLTDRLARAAWERFQAIEAAGGAIRALESGQIARQAQAARAELARRLADRQMKLLGVTDFAIEGGKPVDLAPPGRAVAAPSPRLPGPDSHCPPLSPVRLEDLA
jgi:methylmalonyl-CoA mutase